MSVQDVKLSAEVEPFIPQKKGLEGSLVSMSLSGEAGGGGGSGGMGGGGGGVETTPIPSYLITCYPFVQENQPNRCELLLSFTISVVEPTRAFYCEDESNTASLMLCS